MIEPAWRAAPNTQGEKATELGTTFSWLLSLLPIAHPAGSGASRCYADFPDLAIAHSQINLALHCAPLNLGNIGQNKEPANESVQPHSWCFRLVVRHLPLSARGLLAQCCEISRKLDLRFVGEQSSCAKAGILRGFDSYYTEQCSR